MQLPALVFLYDAPASLAANLARSNFPEIASDSYDSEWPVTGVDLTLGSPAALVAHRDNFYMAEARDLATVRGRLVKAQQRLNRAMPATQTFPMAVYERIYATPAYPAKPILMPAREGLRGIVDAAGVFTGATLVPMRDPSDGRRYFEVQAENVELSSTAVVRAIPVEYRGVTTLGRPHSKSIYSIDAEQDVVGTWVGNRFYYSGLPAGRAYILVLTTRTRSECGYSGLCGRDVSFWSGAVLET